VLTQLFKQKFLRPFFNIIDTSGIAILISITEHHKTPKQIYERIKTALKQVNKDIRQIATELGIEITDVNITSYVARHSWGTIQKRMNQSTSKISEGYGHSGEKVTEIYLSGFEQNELDQMDENLLDL